MLTHLPDRIATRCQPLLMLLGRLAIGALFLPSGFGKLTTLGTFAQSLAAKGVPAAMAYFPFSGWGESFFGDLHVQGREGVAFYTQQKVTTTRWFAEGEGDVWRK